MGAVQRNMGGAYGRTQRGFGYSAQGSGYSTLCIVVVDTTHRKQYGMHCARLAPFSSPGGTLRLTVLRHAFLGAAQAFHDSLSAGMGIASRTLLDAHQPHQNISCREKAMDLKQEHHSRRKKGPPQHMTLLYGAQLRPSYLVCMHGALFDCLFSCSVLEKANGVPMHSHHVACVCG